MSSPFICQDCGEASALEILRFFDDDGRARIRITCRLIVHDQPIVRDIDDPAIPRAADLTPADGLVHDLDLSAKLEEVIAGISQPVEYGVVEHTFALTYPDDYRTLWDRYGHVATHGSKRYTVSAYLARLLGNLTRHGAVAHHPSNGTGRWTYDREVSAWSHTAHKDQPVLSWETFATTNDIDPDTWPATSGFPTS